jgi:hypothetical protein
MQFGSKGLDRAGAWGRPRRGARSDGLPSDPIVSPPDEEKKGRDHSDQDQHPVLAFEAEKRKTLNEKLHRSRSPAFRAK